MSMESLDGGWNDGPREKKAIIELLESCDLELIETVAKLRAQLPDTSTALALASQLESSIEVPALVKLFASLREEAVHAFAVLKDLAVGEDLELQASVLLESGPENYSSTRDHLGAGLLKKVDFEENCRLYTRLRRHWAEQSCRQAFERLLTPIADESLTERRETLAKMWAQNPEASDFLRCWDQSV